MVNSDYRLNDIAYHFFGGIIQQGEMRNQFLLTGGSMVLGYVLQLLFGEKFPKMPKTQQLLKLEKK
jgi:hypothetical protein